MSGQLHQDEKEPIESSPDANPVPQIAHLQKEAELIGRTQKRGRSDRLYKAGTPNLRHCTALHQFYVHETSRFWRHRHEGRVQSSRQPERPRWKQRPGFQASRQPISDWAVRLVPYQFQLGKQRLEAFPVSPEYDPRERPIRTGEGPRCVETPLVGIHPKRLMVHPSVNGRAYPSRVLIHNKYPTTGNETTTSFAEECFDVGNMMKHIGHADCTDAFIGKGHSGRVDNLVDSLIGKGIGGYDLRDYILCEAAA